MAVVCLLLRLLLMAEMYAEGKAFNKKDASQIASQLAVEKLGIANSDSPGIFE